MSLTVNKTGMFEVNKEMYATLLSFYSHKVIFLKSEEIFERLMLYKCVVALLRQKLNAQYNSFMNFSWVMVAAIALRIVKRKQRFL